MFISASCFHTTAPLHTNKGGLPVKSLYLLSYKGELFPIFPHNSLIYINYNHSRISVHPLRQSGCLKKWQAEPALFQVANDGYSYSYEAVRA